MATEEGATGSGVAHGVPSAQGTEPANAGPAIEADDNTEDPGTDADSALDVASDNGSASITSSILKYREENGRTYHSFKDGSYLLPNDAFENERLDLQHHICMITIGNKLFLCPAGEDKPVQRVLDAGCGTGIWAMDFADEHPEAHVIGVDLSPIQPNFVPPNVTFYVDDIEAEWTFNAPFDFVYMRMMSSSIADWPKLISQVLSNLNPGGWFELLDPIFPLDCDDGSFPEDSALYKWGNYMREASTKMGSSLGSALEYKQQLTDAGFTNVVQQNFKWPMNTWPREQRFKELGAWTYENILQGLQALSLAFFTRVLGWSAEEVELFLVQVRKDLANRNIHAYWRIIVVYGQKPE